MFDLFTVPTITVIFGKVLNIQLNIIMFCVLSSEKNKFLN